MDFLEQIEQYSRFWSKHQYVLSSGILKRGIRFLSTTNDHFQKRYSKFYLTKMLQSFCTFENRIQKEKTLFPHHRPVHLRLLKTNFSQNFTLGIVLVVSVDNNTEFFSIDQLLSTVLRILPGVVNVPHMSYLFRDTEKGLIFLYQEIEKKRGRGFSTTDIKGLEQHLSKEAKESIQFLTPSLFIYRNEEEIYRNIVQMGRELHSGKDMPQVTISFQEQTTAGFLRYTVVIVRLIHKNSLSLKQLSTSLPKTIKFTSEMTAEIGTISTHKEYSKESNILSLEVESSLFNQKNGSINLQEARTYIAKALELMIGDYRDYNGGLFYKQKKQLREIKDILDHNEEKTQKLLESLFYSFTPSLFKTFILPEAGKACASCFLEAMEAELPPDKPYFFFKKKEEKFSLIVIKTAQESLKNSITRTVSNYNFPLHQFGYVAQFIEGYYYLALVYQYHSDLSWFDSIEALLKNTYEHAVVDKKILRINFQDGDPLSLNPQLGLDLRCRSLQKALFEGLTRINREGSAELAGAKKVEISSCGKEYFFTLKKLQWSNGEELTAFQFEKTWKKALKSPSQLRPDIFYVLKNGKKARFGEISIEEVGVKALDKRTLKISLEYRAPYFLQLLAHPLFFPLYEDHGEPYVYSGPFSLHSWKRDLSMTLIKNPFYWDFENVYLDVIEISIIRDSILAYEKYKRGEIDWIGGPFSLIPLSDIQSHLHELKQIQTAGIGWIYCNFTQPLLSSAKIRRALGCALDRNKICKKGFLQFPCKTVLPTSISTLQEEEISFPNDPYTLFHEGLQELKLSKHSLPPLTLFHSHIPGQRELAVEVQKQWENAFGIKIERAEKTWNTFSHRLDNRLLHFGSCYRHPFYNDPMYFFNIFYDSSNIHNAFGWQGETFNQWVDKVCEDPQSVHIKKAEEELLKQMPVIPVHTVSYQYLAREKLKGIHFCHSGDVDFKWIYFEED